MIELTKIIPLQPWCCWICKEQGSPSTNREYFISTGVDTWDEGRVYICNMCFRDMIRVSPDAMMFSEYLERVQEFQYLAEQAKIILNGRDALKEALYEIGFDLDKFEENLRGRNDDISNGAEQNSAGVSENSDSTESSSIEESSGNRTELRPVSFSLSPNG